MEMEKKNFIIIKLILLSEKKYDDETKGLENEMNNILTQR